ncbi:MAG TPA: hypothetical protein VEB59_15335, partial [Gemmatimonadales bacterium]|nr:hypothetical protein [Gemmatimonadales bacterium]
LRLADGDHYGETSLGLSLLEGAVLAPAARPGAAGWRLGGPATPVLAVGAAAALLAVAGYRFTALAMFGAMVVLVAGVSRR